MFKPEIRWPIWALVLLSLGGLLLHLRIHPVEASALNWFALGPGIFNILVLPFLFNHRSTASVAYAINWATVLIGISMKILYDVARWEGDVTFGALFLGTTMPHIFLTAARLPIAQVIQDYWWRTEEEMEGRAAAAIEEALPELPEEEPVAPPEQPPVPVVKVKEYSAAARLALQIMFGVIFLGLMTLSAWMNLDEYSERIAEMGPLHGNLVTAGALSGMFATVLIMLQFVCGAGNRPIDIAFGYDKVLKAHRYIGVTAIALATLHPIFLYVTPFYVVPAWQEGLSGEGFGIFALLALLAIGVTSIWRKALQIEYEAWHRIHYLGFAVVVLVAVHALLLGTDMQGGWKRLVWILMLSAYMLLFVWLRIIHPRIIRSRVWRVTSVDPVSPDTWQLDLVPEGHSGIQQIPGQFVNLTLHTPNPAAESHPFTIANAPREDGSVSLVIKEAGDHTSRTGLTEVGARASMEGPYGEFCHLRWGGDRLLLIGGGIGITPLLSMLRYMYAHRDERPVTLVWAAPTEAGILYHDELEEMKPHLNLHVIYVLSEQEDYEGETGFVDKEFLERNLDQEELLDSKIYLCGPKIMMDTVDAALLELDVKAWDIHSEEFEF